MSQQRHSIAPPPKKRSNPVIVGNRVSSINASGYTLTDDASMPLSTESGFWQSDCFDSLNDNIRSEFYSYTSCLKHGRLKANLCERCMGFIATRQTLLDQLKLESLLGNSSQLLGQTSNFLYTAATSSITKSLLRFIWTTIQYLAGVASACFVCFFMMWFVQSSMSDKDRRRKESDDLRSKAADEAWRAKRDRDYNERQSEQLAWEQERDERYRLEKHAQDAWEMQRDNDYRQKLADNESWRMEQEDYHRKADQDYRDRLKQEDEDRRALAEINDREMNAVVEKILKTNSDPENSLLQLEDLRSEKIEIEPDSKIDDKEIYRVVCKEADRLDDESDENRERAVSKLVGRPTNDQSAIIEFHKELEIADEQEDDSDSIRGKLRR